VELATRPTYARKRPLVPSKCFGVTEIGFRASGLNLAVGSIAAAIGPHGPLSFQLMSAAGIVATAGAAQANDILAMLSDHRHG